MYQLFTKGDNLAPSKLRTFAEDKMAEMMELVLEREGTIVRNGEYAVYQHFSPFPTMFSKGCFSRVVKTRD